VLTWLPHVWSRKKYDADYYYDDAYDAYYAYDYAYDYAAAYAADYYARRRATADNVPNVYVSACTSKLNISIHLMSSFHSFLRLIAGLFIVGDRVYWSSNRAEDDTWDEETRLTMLKTALDAYLRDNEKAVTQVITETFPSKCPGQRDKELENRLALLIRTHCFASPS